MLNSIELHKWDYNHDSLWIMFSSIWLLFGTSFNVVNDRYPLITGNYPVNTAFEFADVKSAWFHQTDSKGGHSNFAYSVRVADCQVILIASYVCPIWGWVSRAINAVLENWLFVLQIFIVHLPRTFSSVHILMYKKVQNQWFDCSVYINKSL